MFFFRNNLNLGKKLNVNFERLSKTPPLRKIELSLFSRNLKLKIKTRRRIILLLLESKKLLRTNQRFHPKFGNTPRLKRKVSEFRTPQRVQRCFRISDTPKQCKDVSEFRIPSKSAKMFLPRSGEFFKSYESRLNSIISLLFM